MKKESRKNLFFRYGIIVLAILFLSVFILYRLLDNTVLSAKHWNERAEEDYTRVDTIVPVRGDILASDGSVLATNIDMHVLRIDFRTPKFDEEGYRKALPKIADSLAKYFPRRSRKEWADRLASQLKLDDTLRSRSFPLIDKITKDQMMLIKSFPFFNKISRYTGLYDDPVSVRMRPYGDMARRSIGTLTSCNSRILHGYYGLELALDSLLAGVPGLTKPMILTNMVADWTDVPARDGYNVYTTIDIGIQDLLESTLEKELNECAAEWGSAVLMEVKTGDIKAISNLEISPRPGEGYIESRNRVVMGYEPGSVIKTLSMLIALEDGIVSNLDEAIDINNGKWIYHGKAIKDHINVPSVPVRRVLEYSSNIGMAKIILRRFEKNPGAFYSRVKSLGFLDPMNVGIAGERRPRFDSLPSTSEGERSLASQAYGYATEVSPLYTASLYNAIANGGAYVRPRLVKRIEGNGIDSTLDVTYVRPRICSESNAAILRSMLEAVVWGDKGTAPKVRSDKVRIGGKTGTAKRIIDRQYVPEYRLAFCGMFPIDNPKYTCMVLIGYPTRNHFGAQSTSGRVVREVAEGLYARGYLGGFPDYAKGAVLKNDAPTYRASMDGSRASDVHGRMGLTSHKRILKAPQTVSGGVPDVNGLPLREAVAMIEKAGYAVAVSGSGHVASQTPAQGSRIKPGETVTLNMTD